MMKFSYQSSETETDTEKMLPRRPPLRVIRFRCAVALWCVGFYVFLLFCYCSDMVLRKWKHVFSTITTQTLRSNTEEEGVWERGCVDFRDSEWISRAEETLGIRNPEDWYSIRMTEVREVVRRLP